jgi:hypothetical protein
MGKPSKRKYLQTFLERSLTIQASSTLPQSFDDLILWVQGRLEAQPNAQKLNQTNPKQDADLTVLSAKQLRKEIIRLRNAIREHRKVSNPDSPEHQRLYALLPENKV